MKNCFRDKLTFITSVSIQKSFLRFGSATGFGQIGSWHFLVFLRIWIRVTILTRIFRWIHFSLSFWFFSRFFIWIASIVRGIIFLFESDLIIVWTGIIFRAGFFFLSFSDCRSLKEEKIVYISNDYKLNTGFWNKYICICKAKLSNIKLFYFLCISLSKDVFIKIRSRFSSS